MSEFKDYGRPQGVLASERIEDKKFKKQPFTKKDIPDLQEAISYYTNWINGLGSGLSDASNTRDGSRSLTSHETTTLANLRKYLASYSEILAGIKQ